MAHIEIILISCVMGGFGGLVFGVGNARPNELSIPFREKTVKLGFLGDVATGAVTAVALLYLAPALGVSLENKEFTQVEYVRILALGAIGGFSGRPLLNKISNILVRKVQVLEEKDSQKEKEIQDLEGKVAQGAERVTVSGLLWEGIRSHYAEDYAAANEVLEEARNQDPKNIDVLYWLAMARAYLGDEEAPLLVEAKKIFDEALDIDRDDDRLHYNRSATMCKHRELAKTGGFESPFTEREVITGLRHAVELNEDWIGVLATDSDFKSISKHPEIVAMLAEQGDQEKNMLLVERAPQRAPIKKLAKKRKTTKKKTGKKKKKVKK